MSIKSAFLAMTVFKIQDFEHEVFGKRDSLLRTGELNLFYENLRPFV